jgi:hypothetical protein
VVAAAARAVLAEAASVEGAVAAVVLVVVLVLSSREVNTEEGRGERGGKGAAKSFKNNTNKPQQT